VVFAQADSCRDLSIWLFWVIFTFAARAGDEEFAPDARLKAVWKNPSMAPCSAERLQVADVSAIRRGANAMEIIMMASISLQS
jgi:hypothetical protein